MTSAYDRIPLLMARLDQPGIRDRCVVQFRSVEARMHDRVSIRILDPATHFGKHVENMNGDGTNMHADLKLEVFADYVVIAEYFLHTVKGFKISMSS